MDDQQWPTVGQAKTTQPDDEFKEHSEDQKKCQPDFDKVPTSAAQVNSGFRHAVGQHDDPNCLREEQRPASPIIGQHVDQ